MATPRRQPDRTTPPSPGPLRGSSFPHFERRRLSNGLIVLAARLVRLPLVSLRLVAPAGAAYEPPDARGLATLTGRLLEEGPGDRSSMDTAASVERLGGSLGSGADWDVGYVALSVLARHVGEGLRLLARVATDPAFLPEEVERIRGRRLADLVRRRDSPALLAEDAFARAVYGEGTYGTPLLGTEECLERLDRAAPVRFYEAHYSLAGSTLVAVGDLEPDSLFALAEEVFGSSPGGTVPTLPDLETALLPGVRVHLVDRPGAAQTELRVGHRGVARSHPDYLPLVVVNSLLGGKFTSRINLNLRERHGYTYGASSRLTPRLGPGPFTIKTAVRTAVAGAAAGEILGELSRLREEPVGAEELADTQSYLVGVFPYTLQTVDYLSLRLENLAIHGLPDDYYDTYADEILKLDRGTIREVARRHLHPDRAAIVAVGPADELRPQLEGLGPVELVSPGDLSRAPG